MEEPKPKNHVYYPSTLSELDLSVEYECRFCGREFELFYDEEDEFSYGVKKRYDKNQVCRECVGYLPYDPNCDYSPITYDETTINKMNPIQGISIEALVSMRGYKYDQLSIGALGEVRDIDTLTHDEANKIIVYGNDLYRKKSELK